MKAVYFRRQNLGIEFPFPLPSPRKLRANLAAQPEQASNALRADTVFLPWFSFLFPGSPLTINTFCRSF